MKITALLENTTQRDGMETEHGLSLYIETNGKRILFDMGQTDLFAQNAKALGVDLAQVDFAVLSHGHYDHGGGLAAFLAQNSHAPIYMDKDAFLPHCNGTEKYIGLDPLFKEHPRIVFLENDLSLDAHTHIYSSRTRVTHHGFDACGLTEKTSGGFIPDDFRHEHYLILSEAGKRILFSGCSHKGILNIVDWFSPDVLIGGFHLSKHPLDGELDRISDALDKSNTVYYTCHCTGDAQFGAMKRRMHNLSYLSCGQTVTL